MIHRLNIAAVACLALSACGGTTVEFVPDPVFEDFQDDVRAADAEYRALNSLSVTSARLMPTTGSARFEGRGAVTVTQGALGNGDPALLMLGRSTLEADFARGTVSGQITDLQGVRQAVGTVGGVKDVGGRIAIGGLRSRIGDDSLTPTTEAANTWGGDFEADLDFDGDRVRAVGPMDGKFVGNRVNAPQRSPMRGMTGLGSGLGTMDGAPAVLRLEVFADND
jgi:hypothetical protein